MLASQSHLKAQNFYWYDLSTSKHFISCENALISKEPFSRTFFTPPNNGGYTPTSMYHTARSQRDISLLLSKLCRGKRCRLNPSVSSKTKFMRCTCVYNFHLGKKKTPNGVAFYSQYRRPTFAHFVAFFNGYLTKFNAENKIYIAQIDRSDYTPFIQPFNINFPHSRRYVTWRGFVFSLFIFFQHTQKKFSLSSFMMDFSFIILP